MAKRGAYQIRPPGRPQWTTKDRTMTPPDPGGAMWGARCPECLHRSPTDTMRPGISLRRGSDRSASRTRLVRLSQPPQTRSSRPRPDSSTEATGRGCHSRIPIPGRSSTMLPGVPPARPDIDRPQNAPIPDHRRQDGHPHSFTAWRCLSAPHPQPTVGEGQTPYVTRASEVNTSSGVATARLAAVSHDGESGGRIGRGEPTRSSGPRRASLGSDRG